MVLTVTTCLDNAGRYEEAFRAELAVDEVLASISIVRRRAQPRRRGLRLPALRGAALSCMPLRHEVPLLWHPLPAFAGGNSRDCSNPERCALYAARGVAEYVSTFSRSRCVDDAADKRRALSTNCRSSFAPGSTTPGSRTCMRSFRPCVLVGDPRQQHRGGLRVPRLQGLNIHQIELFAMAQISGALPWMLDAYRRVRSPSAMPSSSATSTSTTRRSSGFARDDSRHPSDPPGADRPSPSTSRARSSTGCSETRQDLSAIPRISSYRSVAFCYPPPCTDVPQSASNQSAAYRPHPADEGQPVRMSMRAPTGRG